jgi:adenine-specific DNA-methyltransferase
LRWQPEDNTAPLIYPIHFADGYVSWPKLDAKKPNALVQVVQTQTVDNIRNCGAVG